MFRRVSLPQSFGRYRVTGSLGAGAMGEVLAAIDELLGREVAVKTLKGRSSGLAARIADERFRLEARAIAQLTHPSVVQVYDLDLAADPPYLVMERVAGPSLKDRIAEGPLPEHEVRALGIQMANALATAHARGVVHRDVKPANILAAGPGTWKLADFGVAHVPDSSLTMTGQFVGSPAYAPPEALVCGQLGPEGDVFSLGATLYQAAAGTWPRADAEVKGLLAPVPPLNTIAPHVAPDLAAAIDRAVSVAPSARPSAADLARALAMVPGTATPPVGIAAVALPMPMRASTPLLMPVVLPTGTATGAVSTVGAVISTTSVGWSASTSSDASPPLGAWTQTSTGAPAPAGAPRFRRAHAIAGIATLLVIILIAVIGNSPSEPADASRGPRVIDAHQPRITTQEAAKDWRKVLEKLKRQQFREARMRLVEWETKYGETEETRRLANQLDAILRR